MSEKYEFLVGKTIVSKEDITERSDDQYYKEDLPQPNRVLTPTTMCTRDLRVDRLNVNVDDSGKCQSVHMG